MNYVASASVKKNINVTAFTKNKIYVVYRNNQGFAKMGFVRYRFPAG